MRQVLVADDHAVVRRGVSSLLRDELGDVEVSEVATGDAVLARMKERIWHLMLLDVMMPGPPIVHLIRTIREYDHTVPILVMTAATEASYAIQVLGAGANGYVGKHRLVEEIVAAVRAVLSGGTYLHAENAVEVARVLATGSQKPHERLSSRELEIFRAIALGKTVKEIAHTLGLSEKTVATYVSRIREKTGITSYVEIARYALLNHLVD